LHDAEPLRGILVPLGGTVPFDVDPAADGIEVVLHDSAGPALEAVIPGGRSDATVSNGSTATRHRTRPGASPRS
jgi:hypothetical protein